MGCIRTWGAKEGDRGIRQRGTNAITKRGRNEARLTKYKGGGKYPVKLKKRKEKKRKRKKKKEGK